MDGVDTSMHGCTELRVHGVGGGAAEELLDHPHPRLVAGDATAGFYRRWNPCGAAPDRDGTPRREAYVWGGVTSGSAVQALWLLLLPFMLANVAHWMQPGTVTFDTVWQARLRPVARALGRLLALSLTLTLVQAVAQASMDLAAWQCAGPGRLCGQQHAWLRFLSEGVWSQPGRRAALGAAVPALVIAVLWVLARATGQRYERHLMPEEVARLDRPLELERREFWNGWRPVGRLRNLHIMAAFALLGVLTVSPGVQHVPSGAGRFLLGLGVLAVAGGAVAVSFPHGRNRTCDELDAAPLSWPALAVRSLPWIGLVIFLAGAAYSAWPWEGTWRSGRTALPGLHLVLAGTFTVQVALLTLLLAVTLALALLERARLRGGAARAEGGEEAAPPVAFHGMGMPVAAATGWLLAGAFSAGLTLRAADLLSRPAPQTLGTGAAAGDRLLVPVPYYWAALGGVLLLVVAVGLAAVLWLQATRGRRTLEQVVRQANGLPAPRPPREPPVQAERSDRARAIARARAWASLTDSGSQAIGWLIGVTALLIPAGILGYALDPAWPSRPPWATLTNLGTWLIGAFALALVGLGRRAYRNPTIRRTVGILWDVGSFWPRELHPLAPPSYCERIVPDLVERVGVLTSRPDDRVVLATHSQGTVIGAAVLLQLDRDTKPAQLAFLSTGSPLRRLYARYFPAYFGHRVFTQLGGLLATRGPDTPADVPGAPGEPAAAPDRWCWQNLYRLTDPIGGHVLSTDRRREPAQAPRQAPEPDHGHTPEPAGAPPRGAAGPDAEAAVDRQLPDPVFDKRPGDTVYPPIHGHFDYFTDAAYPQALQQLIALRR